MKKIKYLFLVFACLLLSSAAVFAAGKVKPVKCSVEIMPNYVWHLFALSNIHDCDNSPYNKMYGETLSAADSAFLYENRNLLVWGNSRTGKLTPLLFFMPFRSEIRYCDYVLLMGVLETAMETLDYEALFARFHLQEHEKARIRQTSFTREEIDVFKRVVNIIEANYPVYEERVWPSVKSILDQSGREIEGRFAGKDPVGKWERILKREFAGELFIPVLTYANYVNELPTANNLTLVRNNFGIGDADKKNVDDLEDLIIHELGIFTIMPLIESLYADPALMTDFNKRHNLLYIAIETFVEKRKNDAFGTEQGKFLHQWDREFDWFYDYYLSNDSTDADIEQLMRRAIAAYGDTFDEGKIMPQQKP